VKKKKVADGGEGERGKPLVGVEVKRAWHRRAKVKGVGLCMVNTVLYCVGGQNGTKGGELEDSAINTDRKRRRCRYTEKEGVWLWKAYVRSAR